MYIRIRRCSNEDIRKRPITANYCLDPRVIAAERIIEVGFL
jgi:hypothetical protein